MKNVQEMTISDLQKEKAKIENGLTECRDIEAELKSNLVEVTAELSRRMKPAKEPKVSDHALFRYIERVYNIDMEAIRQEIMSDNIRSALKAGATGVKVNGIKFKAKDGVLVTVIA